MFNERDRPLMPAQFALRVAVLSGFALVMFSIIFFRLWYLQVLSGDKYLKEAQNNQVRDITVRAPRGEILDRDGNVLVDNRTSLDVQLLPTELPRRRYERKQEFERLGHVIGMSPDEIGKQIREQTKELPANPVTLRQDVPSDIVYYLRENQGQYPGVSVQRVYVRDYPHGTFAAQILGYTREVTEDQLKEPRYQGLQPGDQVGQTGAEDTYDSVLRGTNGLMKVQVDASGQPTGRTLSQIQPKAGENLLLTIDPKVQEAGEAAINSFGGKPGAFVVMNAQNGQILGLGSSPSYDPSVFTKPVIPQSTYDQIFSGDTAPYINRATQSYYPTGSTFKPITAVAALESGVMTPTTTIYDGGSFDIGGGVAPLTNAGGGSYGSLQLPQALQVSSDVFFYNVGALLYQKYQETGDPVQENWATDLGIGHPTGIDLPGEIGGLLPTPAYQNAAYKKAISPDSPSGTTADLAQGEADHPWTEGDNVNQAIGQGALQTDPLQMAVAYAAIGNGGDVVRPHIGHEVQDPNGSVVQEIDPGPQRHLNINPQYRSAILEGLHLAAQAPTGTSDPVFGNFPVPMAGKTGTAERPPQADQSWYVCLAPYPNPKIVVATTIEQGGFGVESAAPVAEHILATYYNEHPEEARAAGGRPPSLGPIQTGAPTVSNPY
jgi:penicillin-binding protein 2